MSSPAWRKRGFAVGDISLAGADRTSTADVYAALGVERGQSIFTVNAAEARARLLDLPWVGDAEVRRNLARHASRSG